MYRLQLISLIHTKGKRKSSLLIADCFISLFGKYARIRCRIFELYKRQEINSSSKKYDFQTKYFVSFFGRYTIKGSDNFTLEIKKVMEDKRIENVLKMVISKAWEDTTFRKNLISDPVNVIQNLTGAKVKIPEGKELIFIDQTDKSKVFVNIPNEPDFEDLELSEEQLEVIAGGGGKDKIWGELARDMFPSFKNYIKF